MKKKEFLIIFITILIIIVNLILFSKNKIFKFNKEVRVAKPVIELVKDEYIEQKVQQNSFPIEYNFSINNYNENYVNEVDLSYQIEAQCSVQDFPIECILYDVDNNQKLELQYGIGPSIKLDKLEKKNRKFKLVIKWKELDCELAEKVEIKLKIKAIQEKGYEVVNENTKNFMLNSNIDFSRK